MSKKQKIIFTAGGTGGHLFPAQTTASELIDQYELLFVAGGLSSCPYFDRDRFAYREVTAATFSFSKPLQVMRRAGKVVRGIRESIKILKEVQPDLVVGFGSYYTLPVLVAATWLKVPIVLHEQNAIPGKVNKLFSRFAKCSAITFPHSASFLKGETVEVAYPLQKMVSKQSAAAYFGLSTDLTTLLVFGGSQGAKALNEMLPQALLKLQGAPFQVLHFTGKPEAVESVAAAYQKKGIPHCVKSFESQMELAWELSDMAVTRAGASTIAERIKTETPGILIPFPHASENHQLYNGRYFVETVRGGELYEQHSLTSKRLTTILQNFLDKQIVEKKNQIEAYKKSRDLKELSTLIQELTS